MNMYPNSRKTIDYVLVQPISEARFFQTVCKFGGSMALHPASVQH